MKSPIFIVGTGRCGSTIFFKLICHHPDLCWHSTLENKYPNSSIVRSLSKHFNRDPYYSILSKLYGGFKPGEVWNVWEKADPDFVEPPRPIQDEDVTEEKKRKFREIVETKIRKSKGDRFIAKLTGWSRIPYLKEIFPDAKFIHVLRDGRAVANSLINFEGWKGWDGPKNWRWGYKEEYEEIWKRYDESYAVLAAIEWKILVDEIEKEGEKLPNDDFETVKYEDLAVNAEKEFKDVFKKFDIHPDEKFFNKISKYDVENRNYKWKRNLSEVEKKKLNEYLEDHLKNYGYSP